MSKSHSPKETILEFPFYLTAYHHAIKHGIKNYKLKRIVSKEGWIWELRFKKEVMKPTLPITPFIVGNPS